MAARRLIPVLVAAVLAAVVVVLVGHDAPGGAAAPPKPLLVRAQLTPSSVEFGDEVVARVVVVMDAREVDAHRVVVEDDFGPLTELGGTTRTVTRRGSLATVVESTPVACLVQRCVSDSGQVLLKLPAVHVVAPGRTATVRFPVLTVRGRTTSSDTSLRADASPPRVTYGISSSTLELVLGIVAALLAAVGVALAVHEVMRLVTGRRRSPPDPLARALVFVREAETRPAPDRRRALELLDQALHGSRAGVSDLAWSKPEPTSDELARIADELQNGDGS
ncbi:MAG TPA: hypothetical protein VKR23_06970 [Gaiellaceae bacterium]|nr:hypothetical protein [Gaiellaceae bacterium]